MPISHHDLGPGRATPPEKLSIPVSTTRGNAGLERRLSRESIRTELYEGPLPDGSSECGTSPVFGSIALNDTRRDGFDRADLIQRLKRQKSPTWTYDHEAAHNTKGRERIVPKLTPKSVTLDRSTVSNDSYTQSPTHESNAAQAGLEIERPRSALHSGDFTQHVAHQRVHDERSSHTYSPNPSPWIATSPPRDFGGFQLDSRFPPFNSPGQYLARSRAPSLSSSLSSSFILKPPTSPLVHSESNDEIEFASSPRDCPNISPDFQRNSRRHTLQASHPVHSVPTIAHYRRPLSGLRRDQTLPYQAHQPRKTPHESTQTPQYQPRRPSISDASPLQHASMVGSYEESILRGRMSTTPSRPLDFVAQIGVLGLGNCKSSLKCPPHVTIPFPAVFYSYSTTSHSRSGKSEDGPSPYVGQIDIENGLPNTDESSESRRRKRTISDRRAAEDTEMLPTKLSNGRDVRKEQKQRRMSTSPRAPPGGSYRIPEKGQIQIIIKNPNKTAVKLFLIPYDLNGMEAGTKTFIRQRSYSAGPIVDLGNSVTSLDPQKDRPVLRYLVHLHICCPSKGRYFLYRSIRVVFANRVPDGKEKLRNEIQHPEPRFTTYKAIRDSSMGSSASNSVAASLAADKEFRRRSSGFPLGAARGAETMHGIASTTYHGSGGAFPYVGRPRAPVDPIPFNLFKVRPVSDGDEGIEDVMLAPTLTASQLSTPQASDSWDGHGTDSGSASGLGEYEKLSKGEAGYGGNPFAGSPVGRKGSEGLLARKLRGLEMGLALDKAEDAEVDNQL
jgi:hypothetical protein